MIKEIYLDLDDVLNSLTMPILRSFGVQCGAYEYALYPRECGYGIWEAVNKLTGSSFTKADFWNSVHPNIWRDVPKSLECDRLIQWAVDKVGRNNVHIATAPIACPFCHANKYVWITQYLPSFLHKKYHITNEKWKLASPERLLIDDAERNTFRWYDHKGKAICLSRPWNDSKWTLEDILNSTEEQYV